MNNQTNLPFLDEEIISNMKELGNGDEAFANRLLIVQLITVYLENLSERVTELSEAMKKSDAPVIERSAHTLKSSSRLIGLVALAEDCQTLEDMGFDKKLENAQPVFERVISATTKAVDVLKNKIIEIEKA
ncbi:Hpt domain-containing protein [Fluviispira multicolorata]|uniref:HPt domain-containing protein n=1 Tax=Fluviispira multicolorata TaxID=2654512 RepID=A0A833N741_9BACT|nr:Hpt domain-containing protein [Fluviispira multicolorata]KAB8031795.1 hypothetical protein GCL57_03910 [Fluviispira multicolorata]